MSLQIALSYDDKQGLTQMTERMGVSSREESLMERAFLLAKLIYLPDLSENHNKGGE